MSETSSLLANSRDSASVSANNKNNNNHSRSESNMTSNTNPTSSSATSSPRRPGGGGGGGGIVGGGDVLSPRTVSFADLRGAPGATTTGDSSSSKATTGGYGTNNNNNSYYNSRRTSGSNNNIWNSSGARGGNPTLSSLNFERQLAEIHQESTFRFLDDAVFRTTILTLSSTIAIGLLAIPFAAHAASLGVLLILLPIFAFLALLSDYILTVASELTKQFSVSQLLVWSVCSLPDQAGLGDDDDLTPTPMSLSRRLAAGAAAGGGSGRNIGGAGLGGTTVSAIFGSVFSPGSQTTGQAGSPNYYSGGGEEGEDDGNFFGTSAGAGGGGGGAGGVGGGADAASSTGASALFGVRPEREYRKAVASVVFWRKITYTTCDIIILCGHFATLVSFARVVCDSAASIAYDWQMPPSMHSRLPWLFIFGVIQFLLTSKRQLFEPPLLSFTKLTSLVVILMCMIALYATTYSGSSETIEINQEPTGRKISHANKGIRYFELNHPEALCALSLLAYLFSWHASSPLIYQELPPPRSVTTKARATIFSCSIALLVFGICAVFGYLSFGRFVASDRDEINHLTWKEATTLRNSPSAGELSAGGGGGGEGGGNIFDLYPRDSTTMTIARVVVLVYSCISYPHIAVTVREVLHRLILVATGESEGMRDATEVLRVSRIAIVFEALLLTATIQAIAASVSGIGVVLALGGSISSSFVLLIVPGVIGLRLYSDCQDESIFDSDDDDDDEENENGNFEAEDENKNSNNNNKPSASRENESEEEEENSSNVSSSNRETSATLSSSLAPSSSSPSSAVPSFVSQGGGGGGGGDGSEVNTYTSSRQYEEKKKKQQEAAEEKEKERQRQERKKKKQQKQKEKRKQQQQQQQQQQKEEEEEIVEEREALQQESSTSPVSGGFLNNNNNNPNSSSSSSPLNMAIPAASLPRERSASARSFGVDSIQSFYAESVLQSTVRNDLTGGLFKFRFRAASMVIICKILIVLGAVVCLGGAFGTLWICF